LDPPLAAFLPLLAAAGVKDVFFMRQIVSPVFFGTLLLPLCISLSELAYINTESEGVNVERRQICYRSNLGSGVTGVVLGAIIWSKIFELRTRCEDRHLATILNWTFGEAIRWKAGMAIHLSWITNGTHWDSVHNLIFPTFCWRQYVKIIIAGNKFSEVPCRFVVAQTPDAFRIAAVAFESIRAFQ
jgi:hypothetical protein